jgi:hypothetical protein
MSTMQCEHGIAHSGEVHAECDGCCAIFEGWIISERQRMMGLIEDMGLILARRDTGVEVGEKIYDAVYGALQPEDAEQVQTEFDSGEFDAE